MIALDGHVRISFLEWSSESAIGKKPDALRRSRPVRILVVSDLHGDLDSVVRAVALVQPELVLSCGDWGDSHEVDEATLLGLLDKVPVYTTFGNHDPLDLLASLRNQDGTPVLLEQGKVQHVAGLRIAAIGGIWAKSHAKRHYVTDADVADAAARIGATGPVDILVTHGCPVGLADFTPTGRHGGQRCFLDAFKTVGPRLHLCGHLHVAQERILKDGRKVINVGQTPEGSIVIVDFQPAKGILDATLEKISAK
jgi:Icc-related predicted phosphoesterase